MTPIEIQISPEQILSAIQEMPETELDVDSSSLANPGAASGTQSL